MSISLFNAVPAGAIGVIFDEQDQPWFKQVDVGEFIEFGNISQVTSQIPPKDKKSRTKITLHPMEGSYTPSKHAKPHDVFLSVNGITTIIMNSRNQRLEKWQLG